MRATIVIRSVTLAAMAVAMLMTGPAMAADYGLKLCDIDPPNWCLSSSGVLWNQNDVEPGETATIGVNLKAPWLGDSEVCEVYFTTLYRSSQMEFLRADRVSDGAGHQALCEPGEVDSQFPAYDCPGCDSRLHCRWIDGFVDTPGIEDEGSGISEIELTFLIPEDSDPTLPTILHSESVWIERWNFDFDDCFPGLDRLYGGPLSTAGVGVPVNYVPEPTQAAMMVAGISLLGVLAGRRR